MTSYILDIPYRITSAAGVQGARVVVYDTAEGNCALPAEANAGGILGITTYAQPIQNYSVGVRKAGVARVVAAGAIAVGEPVNIAGTSGKVKAISETAGTRINCIGFAETSAVADGDIIEVFICLHERTA